MCVCVEEKEEIELGQYNIDHMRVHAQLGLILSDFSKIKGLLSFMNVSKEVVQIIPTHEISIASYSVGIHQLRQRPDLVSWEWGGEKWDRYS